MVGKAHLCVPRSVPPGKLPVPPRKAVKAAAPKPKPQVEPPIKRGRPRIGEPPRPRPWEALGMSQRTWQRRRREGKA